MCIRLGDPPQPTHTHVATAQCCSTPVFPHAVIYSLSGLQIVRRAGLANLLLRGSDAHRVGRVASAVLRHGAACRCMQSVCVALACTPLHLTSACVAL